MKEDTPVMIAQDRSVDPAHSARDHRETRRADVAPPLPARCTFSKRSALDIVLMFALRLSQLVFWQLSVIRTMIFENLSLFKNFPAVVHLL